MLWGLLNSVLEDYSLQFALCIMLPHPSLLFYLLISLFPAQGSAVQQSNVEIASK